MAATSWLLVLVYLIVSYAVVSRALDADPVVADVDESAQIDRDDSASLFSQDFVKNGGGIVTRLMPSAFERETQASTGQTSGRWLVLIDADQRHFGGLTSSAMRRLKMLEGVGFALELDEDVALNTAAIVNENGSQVEFAMLMERFGLGDGDTAMILFHSRKMFRYTGGDAGHTDGRDAQHESENTKREKESRAIVDWIRNTIADPSDGETVPPPPSLFTTFFRNIKAAIGFDVKLPSSSSASKTSVEL